MSFIEINALLDSKGNPSDINCLEQIFLQLSIAEQSHLKEYLQSLVSLQNTITSFHENIRSSRQIDKGKY